MKVVARVEFVADYSSVRSGQVGNRDLSFSLKENSVGPTLLVLLGFISFITVEQSWCRVVPEILPAFASLLFGGASPWFAQVLWNLVMKRGISVLRK